jgi:hypothetical protein
MVTDCRHLWPESSPTASLLHWSFLAGKLGADSALERPFLICLRGVRPFELETHPLVHEPVYDDTGVLLVRSEYPVVFPLATHAYQARSKASPDVNGDGLGDVGSVRPGRFVLHNVTDPGSAEIVFRVSMPDGSWRLRAWRDFDGDKKLSPEEMQQSEDARTGAQVGSEGTWADSILLHGGIDEPPDRSGNAPKHRFSIGCFTASRKWRQLIAEKCGPDGRADMVLINAADALPLVHGAPIDDGDSERPVA